MTASDGAGRAELAATRRLVRRLLACPLCGRAGGAIAEGAEYCHRCAAFYAPTQLQLWSWASGFDLKTLAPLARVSKRTVMRAARGIRISEEHAARLSRATGIPTRVFVEEATPA